MELRDNGESRRESWLPDIGNITSWFADGDAPWAYTAWGRKFLEYRKTRHGKGSAVLARTPSTLRRACGWVLH